MSTLPTIAGRAVCGVATARVIPPINGRTAGPPLGAPPPAGRSGVIPCAGRGGSAPTPGWREGRRDEVLAPRSRRFAAARSRGERDAGKTRGARRELGGLKTSINTRRTAHSVRTGGSAADAHRCYSFRFRGRQVSRRGGRSPCSHQRSARNPHGRWGRTAQGRARLSRH